MTDRVGIVISTLGAPGGAERVAVTMANDWVGRGRPVTIICQDRPGTSSFYALAPDVQLLQVGGRADSANPISATRNNLQRIRMLRRAIATSGAAVIIAFVDQTNVLTLLATRRLHLPVVVTEHIDVRRHRLRLPWRLLRSATYRWAAVVVTLSAADRAALPRSAVDRAIVIPNPVSTPGVGAQLDPGAASDAEHGTILAIGRLHPQKGFDVLIRAFSAIAQAHPGWNLVIHGEGPLRDELERLVAADGLSSRVSLPGVTSDPDAALQRAELFVLPSRYEGFPMVLCEAMAVGIAVVASDIPGGTRDIVRPGVDALTVPPDDPLALSAAMDRLIRDPAERRRLGDRGREILDRFGTRHVMAEWDRLLTSLTPVP